MVEVKMYTIHGCPYCKKAKLFFEQKNIKIDEINLDEEPHRRPEMETVSNGGTTVPQIFINGNLIGGCDDLYRKALAGEIEPLLED